MKEIVKAVDQKTLDELVSAIQESATNDSAWGKVLIAADALRNSFREASNPVKKRDVLITFRVSKEEKDAIQRAARKHQLNSVSLFARHAVFEKVNDIL